MVGTFVCAALLAANTPVANDATNRIASIEARIGGRLGVAALDIGSGKRLDYRAEERFPMCSTFKFLAAAAVLKRVDEKQERLDRFVPYGVKDLLEYAPVTKKHFNEGGMTVGALCEAAIVQSDNTAGNLVLQTIGGPAGLTKFLRTLGDDITPLDRSEPELNSAIPGDDRDTTSSGSMLNDMRKLLTGDVVSPLSRRQLEDWLQSNQTGAAMIRAGVTAAWIIGDKTGRGANGATNDIAIMRSQGRPPVLLAVYSVGSIAPSDKRAEAIAEVAKVVIESM